MADRSTFVRTRSVRPERVTPRARVQRNLLAALSQYIATREPERDIVRAFIVLHAYDISGRRIGGGGSV